MSWHRRIKRVEWILDSVRFGLRGKARYTSLISMIWLYPIHSLNLYHCLLASSLGW